MRCYRFPKILCACAVDNNHNNDGNGGGGSCNDNSVIAVTELHVKGHSIVQILLGRPGK